MYLNDEVEIITPDEQFITKVSGFRNEEGEDVELANTNDDIYVKFDISPKDYKYAIARTVGIKGEC